MNNNNFIAKIIIIDSPSYHADGYMQAVTYGRLHAGGYIWAFTCRQLHMGVYMQAVTYAYGRLHAGGYLGNGVK